MVARCVLGIIESAREAPELVVLDPWQVHGSPRGQNRQILFRPSAAAPAPEGSGEAGVRQLRLQLLRLFWRRTSRHSRLSRWGIWSMMQRKMTMSGLGGLGQGTRACSRRLWRGRGARQIWKPLRGRCPVQVRGGFHAGFMPCLYSPFQVSCHTLLASCLHLGLWGRLLTGYLLQSAWPFADRLVSRQQVLGFVGTGSLQGA